MGKYGGLEWLLQYIYWILLIKLQKNIFWFLSLSYDFSTTSLMILWTSFLKHATSSDSAPVHVARGINLPLSVTQLQCILETFQQNDDIGIIAIPV
jgi:hypothetical protein